MSNAARWKLVLGSPADADNDIPLSPDYGHMDQVLTALYDSEQAERKAGLGGSAPKVSRWLGDIRRYFPSSVVAVMQKDAMERLGLQQLLLEPEVLRTVQPDVHLVGLLMSLGRVMPAKVKHTAREVVQRVVHDLEQRLANPLRQAVQGALSRAVRNPRPRYQEINWAATIRANLKHYQPAYKTVIPEKLVGFGRRGQALKEIVLCVDQSGSMAASVVYAGVFGAVLASLKAVKTHMVVFDTSVADLTQELQDPVDLLFGIQLGGGTDINRALTYCQQLITRPADTIMVLISDLYEGGNEAEMLRRAAALKAAGVTLVALLALSDEGSPGFDRRMAEQLAALGVPSFACTPDQFPALMAAAIQGRDLGTFVR
ncbi:VWA domain-containing protein [Hymenobacter cellulosivorans]|uniref:VWA domain-containing protein n=1 Tax=Hymenobacter cellulosivorans TaxID=2932249 RepID=A0ABY4F4V3_9BACT|nr:VWA domain-containing protein [Hymenobacter cellulosivorans]UOQ51699.1 VWA domain-containing protein [Hymenobacter cellulosivorans]